MTHFGNRRPGATFGIDCPGAECGFSLIEALVAMIILSIGILGIVSLLALSKVSQHESIQRVRAVSLADDIIERIRRNPAGLSVYDIGLSSPLGGASLGTEPSPNCNFSRCNTSELAGHDLWAWERLLDGTSATLADGNTTSNTVGMGNVRACIEFTADTGKSNSGIIDIVLQWKGLKETSDAVPGGGVVCGSAVGEDKARRQLIVSSYVLDETEL